MSALSLSVHIISFPTNKNISLTCCKKKQEPIMANSHYFLLLFLCIPLSLKLTLALGTDAAYPTVPDCSPPNEVPKPVRREVYGGGRIFDISHRYTVDMPSYDTEDGKLGKFLRLAQDMKNGSIVNISELKIIAHSGTHVDAPGHVFDHYFDAGYDVDTLDLEVLNGPALLVDVPRDKNITAEVMESLKIPKGVRRVVFRTLNTDRGLMFNKKFDTSFVGFMRDGARWLVDNTDIKLVGVDYLSVAAFDDLLPVHYVFLESREIILVEGLKLDDVPAGIYSLHCLPLRLLGSDGSPIRCILIKS